MNAAEEEIQELKNLFKAAIANNKGYISYGCRYGQFETGCAAE